MEISDYLVIIKRRAWILVAVPLLAGAAVAALVLASGPRYVATTTVAAPALIGGPSSNQYSGSNGPRAFVANFTAAATSSRVVSEVAERTGVPASAVAAGLAAAPIGDSSLIQVTFRGPAPRSVAAPVAEAAAGATIRFLFQTQVTLAERTVAEAEKAVRAADAKLNAFYRSAGLALPDRAYEIRAQQVANLQARQAELQAGGDYGAAAALATSIRTKQAELRALVPKVATYQSLVEAKQRASGKLSVMQQGLDQARAQFQAADPRSAVTPAATRRVSLVAELARKVGPAVGAGLFLAVGIVALLELLARRPQAEPEVEVEAAADGRPELGPRPQGPEVEARRPGPARPELKPRPELEARSKSAASPRG